MAIWLPWWPTERLIPPPAGDPGASSPPPLAITAERKGRSILEAVDPVAWRLGLRPGMPLADARAIAPEVATHPADQAGDAKGLEGLARWATRFTPRVSRAPKGAHGLILDARGCIHLFGGARELIRDARKGLARFRLTARAAIAPTLGAAWALARHHRGSDEMIVAGDILKAIAHLPPVALRIAPETARGLESFGIRTVGLLNRLDAESVGERFGPEPVQRLEEALGAREERIQTLLPPPSREVRIAFAEPISTREDLDRAVDSLLEKLCGALERTREGARHLRLSARRVDGKEEIVEAGASRPLRRKEPLARLFAEKLGKIRPGFGVEAMSLRADRVDPLVEEQLDWIKPRGSDEPLAALIDRLGNRLGFEKIARMAPRESWIPERAVLGAPPLAPLGPNTPAAWPEGRRRPIRLLDPARPVSLLGSEGALLLLRPGSRPLRLLEMRGPERIASEWWRAEDAFRDYYRVEDEDGGRYWLYRIRDGDAAPKWFLHGLFA